MANRDDSAGGRRRWARVAAVALVLAVLGALAGLAVGIATRARVELAGSNTSIWLEPGRDVDRVGVPGLVTLTRPTSRALLGEPIGVRAVVDLDVSPLVRDGTLNTDVLPAYVQAFSDPEQLVSDIRHEFIWHLARFVVGGAVLVLLLGAAWWRYRAWRAAYDRRYFADPAVRTLARSYRRPERTWLVRTVAAVVIALVLAAVPSSRPEPGRATTVVGNPVLADTPLAGVQVDGLLSPALVAARNYIRTYAGQTDEYYTRLRTALLTRLDADEPVLPTGVGDEDVVRFGFVTDRHCNTGMDRVTVALLKHYGITTLVSAGDDAFSGTFAFEAACTRNLAQQSLRAGITDVVAAGNHDSDMTVDDERDQGMKTLTGDAVEVDGLRFVGRPDPRSSRYGEGIRPAAKAEQERVVTEQGEAIGRAGCDTDAPVIAVAHDPDAGARALATGCGRITLALDGHTHAQAGPETVVLPGGGTGARFTGASGGGAPGQGAVDRTFASSLTVGPLNHDAFVYVVGVERTSGRLVGVSEFRFTPAQDIVITPDVG